MSWDMQSLEASDNQNEVTLTSFWGGGEHRAIQLTQSTGKNMGVPEGTTQFVQLSRTQLLKLVMRVVAWDLGLISEHNPK